MICTWGDCERDVIAIGFCAEHHEDYRRKAALFNDIGRAPGLSERVLFSDRMRIHEYLWAQGWRRDVRPEDVTERLVTRPA